MIRYRQTAAKPEEGSASSVLPTHLAERIYRDAGNRLSNAARGSALLGLILAFATFMFLFEISGSYASPILIIVVGIAIIFNYMIGSQE